MAGIHDFWDFRDEFNGGGIFGASATEYDPWVVTDTSSAGTPTYTRLDIGETNGVFRPGVAQLAFDSQAEAQNVCLSFGDKLAFPLDNIKGYECGLRLVGAAGGAKDSTTTLAWGLTGDRNDAIDSIAIAALFRLAAATAVNTVVVESDDGTNNNDDVASGVVLTDSEWFKCTIDFSNKEDVKFYLGSSGLTRVGASVKFDMSNYHAGLQPFFQLQKASDANVDALQIDYVRVWGIR